MTMTRRAFAGALAVAASLIGSSSIAQAQSPPPSSTVPSATPAPAPAPARPGAATGVVIFYRPIESTGPIHLTLGLTTARLRSGRTLRYLADAGFNVFGAVGPNEVSAAAPVDVVPNAVQYVRVSLRETGEVDVVVVAATDAEREVSGLEPESDVAAPVLAPAPPVTPPPPVEPPTPPRPPRAPNPQVWPGRTLLGVHVIGGQIRMDGASVTGYRLAFDGLRLVRRGGPATAWAGGGLAYTVGTAGNQLPNQALQVAAVVALTFERGLKIPLVPSLRTGLAVDVVLVEGQTSVAAMIGVGLRVGAGLHYYVKRKFGLGIETDFTIGGGAFPSAIGFCGRGAGGYCGGFYGTWDLGLGARFAL
jgi:hypothetical protein